MRKKYKKTPENDGIIPVAHKNINFLAIQKRIIFNRR